MEKINRQFEVFYEPLKLAKDFFVRIHYIFSTILSYARIRAIRAIRHGNYALFTFLTFLSNMWLRGTSWKTTANY